jgi:hypothetical protein
VRRKKRGKGGIKGKEKEDVEGEVGGEREEEEGEKAKSL